MTDRQILDALIKKIEEYAFAMPAANNWTPQFMGLVTATRQALAENDATKFADVRASARQNLLGPLAPDPLDRRPNA